MHESAEAEPAEVAPESDEEEAAPAPQLERLQKILARAGIASRRHAEELITEGRVQVNGQVVSTLGAKADPARDHIRVDGKLLQGAERQRYFMLNKPKGYVTTVSDPEGRPTVMEFFAKMGERLYPVGRLDYLSEGLLLVTNDGELAHALTRAASGVEKTYLVKVAGQPAEEALERLRTGVAIERGKPGEGKVHTAPARIRQVRAGDNPWFEVVIIEGRNRELRKMFEEIGHHVEKIRRVGYGPLVLDMEPGKLRELDAEEVAALRLTAEGKMKPRRMKTTLMLPKEARRPAGQRFERPADRGGKPARYGQNRPTRPATSRPYGDRPAATSGTSDSRPRKTFGSDKPFRPARPVGGEFRTSTGRGPERGPARTADRGPARPAWKRDDRAVRPSGPPSGRPPARRAWKKDTGPGRGFTSRPGGGKPAWSKPAGERPAFNRNPNRPDSRTQGRPAAPRREAPAPDREFAPKRPSRLHIESVEPERPAAHRPDRPKFDRPRPDKPRFDKPRFDKPRSGTSRPGQSRFDKPRSDRPDFNRPRPDRPRPDRAGPEQSGMGRASTGRPDTGRTNTGSAGGSASSRGRSGLARPFTTSSGKLRAGGARPSSKPGRPASAGRSKPGFGARPGGFSKPKSGFKGKASGSGPRRSGPRPGGKQGPGGKRPGGAGGGRKRG
ncbi:MAG: pseudouridine synthase [Acidobacteriota bacterium]|nr:pseudouridine synthase [Acidobacteriota bacterium]